MISEIKIINAASYGPDTQEVSGLSKVNIFYGANGNSTTHEMVFGRLNTIFNKDIESKK